MKLVGAISTAVLSLSLGIGIPAYAQQEQHDQQENKDKPAQEKDKNKEQEGKSAQQQDKNTKQEEKNAQQQDRNNQQEQRNAQSTQHADSKGAGRIPADRYKANFGQEHRFRVSESNYRDRRFQYGGYWFGFEGAWPSNWLYTQDVFVIEINGVYYLCNANYPGVNIMLSVTL